MLHKIMEDTRLLENELLQYEPQKAYWVEYVSKTEIQKKLRLSVTDGCNFNCFFCHNEGQESITSSTGFMSVSEITKIVEIAVRCGIETVKLTGGEPLIYSDGKSNIIDLVTEIAALRDIGHKFSLSLVTNGYLLKQYAARLKQAGIDRITISLTTLSQNIFHKFVRQAKTGSVDRIVEGIEAATSTGLKPIKVNMVLFSSSTSGQGNISEIPNIIKVCKKLQVDELRLYTLLWHNQFLSFDEYYHYWDSGIFSQIDFLDCGITDELKTRLFSDLRLFGKNWSLFVYPKSRMVINCDGLPVAFETMMSGRFEAEAPCNDCEFPHRCQEGPYAFRVSARGDIRGCLLSRNSINILQAIRNGASDDELINLFNSSFSLLPR